MDTEQAITLVNIEPLLVADLKKKGSYSLIPQMIMEVFGFLTKAGIPPAGPPVFLCHECSREAAFAADAAGTADVEIAIPVGKRFAPSGGITCTSLPGGRMARVLHRGPYEACVPTYERLFAWIQARGLQITGPIREMYLNDPREVGPEETLTEILAPVG